MTNATKPFFDRPQFTCARRAASLIAIVALSVITCACSQELSPAEKNRILNEKRPVPFVGHTLYMPIRIAPNFHANAQKQVEVIRLELLWPELEAVTPENANEFHAPGGGRTVSILVDSLAQISEDRRKDVLLTGRASFEQFVEREIKPSRYGLDVIGAKVVRKDEIIGNSSFFDDDILSNQSNGVLESYLHCTPEVIPDPEPARLTGRELIPVPHCEHMFYLDEINAEVSLHYRRMYLREWREIESQTRALLRSFYSK